MRAALAAVLFVTVMSCGGTSTAATPSPAGLLSNPCSYRDSRGDTCQVTVLADTGQFAASQATASRYGVVENLGAGDKSFYSAQLQSPGVWIFDLGLMKGGAFASALCGARFGSSNPKPQAARLGNLIASRL